MIEGLSRLGDDYKDAVEYVCRCDDKPHSIYHEHICSIVEAPSLKEGSGKEL